MQVAKTIQISLKNGQVLTLDMTQQLVEGIISTFMLDNADFITERHVKYYLASAMKNAVEQSGDEDVEKPI